ncbi:MAG TPA: hypothetical protein VJO34_01030 [Methylomirabilota bacterium]|nr:hypothetical protein [Methylomirabilota bacterium]
MSILVGVALILLPVWIVSHAEAHKPQTPAAVKESASTAPPWIQIASDSAQLQDRLERRFVVGVFRASDGKPLAGARVELLADMRTMPGAHRVPPALFTAGAEPGTYVGGVRLPMAGAWLFRVKVSGPVTGVVDFVDRVGKEGTGLFSTPSETSLRLQDSLNLAGRGIHFLGAAIWLGGLVMLAIQTVGRSTPLGLLASPKSVFVWQTVGLALLFLTGAYNLFFNTPPGRLITIDDLEWMVAQPFGVLYTGLLLYKLGTFLLLLGLGVWALRRWRDLPTLTWVRLNMALGFVIVAIGGALSYLHISIHSRPGF